MDALIAIQVSNLAEIKQIHSYVMTCLGYPGFTARFF